MSWGNMTSHALEKYYIGTHPAISMDWKSVLCALVLVSPLVTILTTTIQSWYGLRSNRNGREPPIKPHWVPLLGDLFGFLLHPKRLIDDIWYFPVLPYLF